MRNISIVGLLLATLLVFFLETVAGMVLVFAMAKDAFNPGLTEDQAMEALNQVVTGPAFLGWSLVLGTVCVVIGGYVVGRFAKQKPYLNAVVFAVIGCLITAFLTNPELPAWFNLMGYVVVLPAALLGAWLATRGKGASAAGQPAKE